MSRYNLVEAFKIEERNLWFSVLNCYVVGCQPWNTHIHPPPNTHTHTPLNVNPTYRRKLAFLSLQFHV